MLYTSVHLYSRAANNKSNNENQEEEDSDNSYEASHLRRSVFYPGTGGADENTIEEDEDIFPGGILNVPMAPREASRAEWRKEFSEQVFPRLCEF